jgi:hypothetical protein
VKFWDSSAVVPLLFTESSSEQVETLLETDREQHVWWATEVECTSAVARAERLHTPSVEITRALARLQHLASRWYELHPTEAIRTFAKRLLRVHPLRSSDALQLAAALVLADGDTASIEVVALDDRLRDAAAREGFAVLPQPRGR